MRAFLVVLATLAHLWQGAIAPYLAAEVFLFKSCSFKRTVGLGGRQIESNTEAIPLK